MNFASTLSVILAVVLFSTLIVNVNNQYLSATEDIYLTIHQANHQALGEYLLDLFMAHPYNDLDKYDDTIDSLINFGDESNFVDINVFFCDDNGDSVGSSDDYQKIEISVSDSLNSNRLTKVYRIYSNLMEE